MTDQTPLDIAQQAMQSNRDDTATRMRFFERLADSEVYLLLKQEAIGDNLAPETIEIEGAEYLLAFDREERLADFTSAGAHHAAMSGRVLANMLAGQGIGIGLNLGVAKSAVLIPADAMLWLAEMLENAPVFVTEQPVSINAPEGFSDTLLQAIDTKLATAAGMAQSAYLVSVTYADSRQSQMLAIINAVPQAQSAIAKAVSEALNFSAVELSAVEHGQIDVAFFSSDDPVCQLLGRVGLRFNLPELKLQTRNVAAPGTDPDSPPILR